MSVEVKGAAELAARLRTLATAIPVELGRALYQEALIEQKESMRRTPVLTNALRGSHVTTKPVINGREVTVSIEVGGSAAPYAIYVHENLEVDHPNGQAKFLESTINESAPFMAARLAKRIDLNRMAGR